MPIKKKFESLEPTDYYGIVEEVVEADPKNGRTRSFLLIDCVQSNRFKEQGAAIIEDRSALALVRAMSTPKRWDEQFGLGPVAKGDWLSFRVGDRGHLPRAWELRADENYAAGRPRSIERMSRIDSQAFDRRNENQKLLYSLRAATRTPSKQRPVVSAQVALQHIAQNSDVEIIVLDVGQAAAVLIKQDGRPVGFFDLGAPIWFNKGSLPKKFVSPDVPGGFVILSHWDFDHFDLGRRHQPYHSLNWYAPVQPVGPNAARFQMELGNRLTFIDGPASYSGFKLSRGKSTTKNDRNGTGYQLRYEEDGRAVLLTGDAGYDDIQPHMLVDIDSLTVPHHGGRSVAAPPSPNSPSRAIASYGLPNSYRHPHLQTVISHEGLGWQVSTTATTPTRARGPRLLFP